MTKVHHLLEQEAQELKRLLAVKPGEIAGRNVVNSEDLTREALLRVKTGLASRRLHEAATSASEVLGRFTLGTPVAVLCLKSNERGGKQNGRPRSW